MGERTSQGERGAVMIIEATFVFPIMFIIILVMILAGNAYFQHARVERAVVEAAVDGAARIENPMLSSVIESGTVPTSTSEEDVMPYRYLLTGNAQTVANQVASDLKERIESVNSIVFSGMEPKNVSVVVNPKIYLLMSSLEVSCEFDIELPIRMLFADENVCFHYSVSMVEPIGDPAELIRNVSTVQDIMERSETASEIASKFSEAASRLAGFIN